MKSYGEDLPNVSPGELKRMRQVLVAVTSLSVVNFIMLMIILLK